MQGTSEKILPKGAKKAGCRRTLPFVFSFEHQKTLLRAANTGEFFFLLVVRFIPETGRTGTDCAPGDKAPKPTGRTVVTTSDTSLYIEVYFTL